MVGCSVHLTLLHTDFIPGFVCSADFLWNHDPPQIVYTAYNACCFHSLFSFEVVFAGKVELCSGGNFATEQDFVLAI